MPNITVPTVLFDNNGNPSQELKLWIENVTADSLITGAGSPEGKVEANESREYMDKEGAPGAIKYIKQVNSVGGNKKLGWVLV